MEVSLRQQCQFLNYCHELFHGNTSGERIAAFANEQVKLFEAGVRDVRLHDCAIWLIDNVR